MAEFMLSDADLDRMERDLDELVFPDFEAIRALVAETRLLRHTVGRYSVALAAIGAEVHRAQKETR